MLFDVTSLRDEYLIFHASWESIIIQDFIITQDFMSCMRTNISGCCGNVIRISQMHFEVLKLMKSTAPCGLSWTNNWVHSSSCVQTLGIWTLTLTCVTSPHRPGVFRSSSVTIKQLNSQQM